VVDFALTYHVEGPRERPSGEIYEEIARQVELADRLGFAHAWFGEHHAHAHVGHAPHPLLYAIHLAGRTKQIHLGSAVICVNLHHPVMLAEQIAMADVLSGGRMSLGLGTGSTAAEFALFGVELSEPARRARFVEVLDLMEAAWRGDELHAQGEHLRVSSPPLLPRPTRDMRGGLWIGANSPDSASLAGRRGYGLQLSNLRTLPQLRELVAAYRAGRDAANRPISPERIAASAPFYVADTDERAVDQFTPALDEILRENRRSLPETTADVRVKTAREQISALRFAVGSPERVAAELLRLREELPFTTLNIRPRWLGLSAEQVERSIELFALAVLPVLERAWGGRIRR
jgi:alkanesulfonate monooxygenase SsuD/methylene tetrahydromethanopterin reductase-like flavin-dependent oxidoreductase (luciferase family)